MKGKVTSNNEPSVFIKLKGHVKKRILAVVDTGFNGYLAVPKNMIRKQGWQLIGSEKYEVATGELKTFEVFLGEIEWDKKDLPVYALVTNSEDVLVGTKLLKKSVLTVDFPAKEVKIS